MAPKEYMYNTVTRWIIKSSKQLFSHTRLLIKNFAPIKSIISNVR